MKYLRINPCESFKEFVHHFWLGEFEQGDAFTYISTADSCCKLIFPYEIQAGNSPKNATIPFSCIQGQTHRFEQFPASGSWGMFGVYLYPQAIKQLFMMPANELTNQMLGLETVIGQKGKHLHEKMATAANTAERLEIISDFLTGLRDRHYQKEMSITAAMQEIRRQRGAVNISGISKNYFLSQRQFERKFKEFSGFSPKLYARIVRFEASLNEYDKSASLTDLAHTCGYYDQSHFIHDFRSFSGYHPKDYFSRFSQTGLSVP